MSIEEVKEEPPLAWYNPWSYVPKWCPTSMALLAAAERAVFSKIWPVIVSRHVPINKGENQIRTISLNLEAQRTPLVMIHGMGSGVALWTMNIESLSKRRTCHAFDVLGFGRSSRPRFSKDGMLAEMEFVESIEEWRREMKLDKFILLGHSLGGFLAASYALRYPDRLKHLILVDPWGFPERPVEAETPRRIPTWMRAIAALLQPFNPLAAVRVAGPLGPNIVRRFRPDLLRKFSEAADEDTVAAYIYHCNVQYPSGETGFKNMTLPYGWAKYPMIKRIKDVPNNLAMTFIYGSRSWIDSSIGYEIKYLRNEANVQVEVIKGAGHHVYADRLTEFNDLVNKICLSVDNPNDSDDTENENL